MEKSFKCLDCGVDVRAKRFDHARCANCRASKRKLYLAEQEHAYRKPCINCGQLATRRADRCRKCSDKDKMQRLDISRENSVHWKGGRSKDGHGYVHILVAPNLRNGRRYRAEHIVVWEQVNGEPLPKGWIVHHVNHIKDDNRPENLEAMPRSKHNHQHGEQRILELEAENRRLREQLNGNLSP